MKLPWYPGTSPAIKGEPDGQLHMQTLRVSNLYLRMYLTYNVGTCLGNRYQAYAPKTYQYHGRARRESDNLAELDVLKLQCR